MKLMVRELVELRMGRRKSHGQFCILFDCFALSTVKSPKLYQGVVYILPSLELPYQGGINLTHCFLTSGRAKEKGWYSLLPSLALQGVALVRSGEVIVWGIKL